MRPASLLTAQDRSLVQMCIRDMPLVSLLWLRWRLRRARPEERLRLTERATKHAADNRRRAQDRLRALLKKGRTRRAAP